MRKPSLLSLLGVSLLAALAACNDPPTPTAVRAKVATDVGYVVAQANAASTGATLPSTAALSLLSGFVPGSSAATTSTGWKTVTQFLPKAAAITKKSRLAADTGSTDQSDQISAQAIIDYLNTKLFTDANSLGNGIYTVPAALACTVDSFDDSGNATSSLDAGCAAKFAQADVRIRVAEDGDTLTFALQLDADHDEPFSVSLSHDGVSLSVDLDNADHAVAALASIFAETPPNVRLAGQATAKLAILGPAHAQASLTIDRDLAVAIADQGQDLDGAHAFHLTSVKAPILSIDLDGTAHAGSAAFALGASTLQIPTDNDSTAVDFPGVTGSASFANGGPLTLTGMGLGARTLTVSRNGQRAFGLDLNPDDHRTFDATVATDGTFAVSPKLDLRLAVDHAVLGDTAGPYDVTQLLLTGSVGPNGDTGFKVVTGSFSLVTNPASYGLTATAGQCVARTDVVDANSGTFYEQWLAGVCQ